MALLLDWSYVRGEPEHREALLKLINELEGSGPALARLTDGSALVGPGIDRVERCPNRRIRGILTNEL